LQFFHGFVIAGLAGHGHGLFAFACFRLARLDRWRAGLAVEHVCLNPFVRWLCPQCGGESLSITRARPFQFHCMPSELDSFAQCHPKAVCYCSVPLVGLDAAAAMVISPGQLSSFVYWGGASCRRRLIKPCLSNFPKHSASVFSEDQISLSFSSVIARSFDRCK
jgi:hypothetical protein